MAEVTVRRAGEIQRAVYDVLLQLGEGLPAGEVIARCQQHLDLTEYELGEYPSSPGKPRFDKIVRFTSIAHVKAGWLVKSRSEGWQVTTDGREAFERYTDPTEFQQEASRRYRIWKQSQTDDDASIGLGDEDDTAAATLEEAMDASWAQVKEYLDLMPPYDFQDLVGALLGAMGYHVAWTAPPGPDRGIDLVAYTDPLGAAGPGSRSR